MAIQLKWVKCKDHWCPLSRVNLTDVKTEGVYVIWDTDGDVIRVGQGNIKARLIAHRKDREIMSHGKDLLVTWASVPAAQQDGVERFLADEFLPEVGHRFPEAPPLAVNLPGQ